MSTDFSQKNAPDFQSWQTTNLVNFAHDAYQKMREQQEEIEHLRLDLKAALKAYRDLLRGLGK